MPLFSLPELQISPRKIGKSPNNKCQDLWTGQQDFLGYRTQTSLSGSRNKLIFIAHFQTQATSLKFQPTNKWHNKHLRFPSPCFVGFLKLSLHFGQVLYQFFCLNGLFGTESITAATLIKAGVKNLATSSYLNYSQRKITLN